MKNVKLNYIKPEFEGNSKQMKYGHNNFTSCTFEEYKKSTFKKYVTYIDKFPDGYFDLILIDGRARSSCLARSISKVRKGGHIILDNSEREYYSEAMDLLKDKKRMDYFGFGPFLYTFWQTTVWEI